MRFGTFHFSRERQFGFLAAIPAFFAANATAIAATAAVASAVTGIAAASGAFTSKATTINPNPTPTANQLVDNAGGVDPANPQQLARAALIMTSGQGVQGSNPSNRYALLGNAAGLS